MSKESEQFQQLYSLKLYQRLKVTAVVRNTFQNTPWIEVVSFSPLPAKLDTGVLTHLYRGEKLMAERQWQRAIAELQRVPGNSVPETALAAAYSNLCTCMLRIGEADKAVPFLKSASALTRGNGLQIEAMLETAKGIPAKEIDRTVNVAAVQDSNRPMWEAFDAGKGAKTPQTGNPVAALAR